MTTLEGARAAPRQARGGRPRGIERQLARPEARLAKYREDKLHPRLPPRPAGLLPDEQGARARRELVSPFEERRKLMSGHAVVGRRHVGRVLQLITASTGLDRFEWGVTLLSDDLTALKDVVYDMRFDEVTAVYGRFGEFLVRPHPRPGRPAAAVRTRLTPRTILTGSPRVSRQRTCYPVDRPAGHRPGDHPPS